MTQPGPTYPISPDEADRLADLESYAILDTPEEYVFNHITGLASRVFEVPIALVSLVAEDRQWFKAKVGLAASETSRDVSFCAHAIQSDDTMIIPDAFADARTCDNPLVTDDPGIRFYAGAPLITPRGNRLGTLCVIDTIPRFAPTSEEERTLADFADLVMDRMNLQRAEAAQRKLEAVLVDKNRDLEAQKARLEEALNKEKELNGLQRQFVSMVSHEFRTPLSIIDCGAQRLLKHSATVTPVQIQNKMETTRQSIRQLTALMESVLSAARLEDDAIKCDPNPCNPAHAIFGLAESYQELNPSHRIVTDLEQLPDQFSMDVTLMRQVFSNLISNAIKYSPSGTKVRIDGRGDIHGGITISVRDEGPGILESETKHIFERFFRASTSVGVAGVGMGLYIAKRLVGMHGGRIDMLREEKRGTTFSVHLPAGMESMA